MIYKDERIASQIYNTVWKHNFGHERLDRYVCSISDEDTLKAKLGTLVFLLAFPDHFLRCSHEELGPVRRCMDREDEQRIQLLVANCPWMTMKSESL